MKKSISNRYDICYLLEKEVSKRDTIWEISPDKPDPLLIARKYKDEYIALICALYAYGNAFQIVKFLSSLDFSLLDKDAECIRRNLSDKYYRFQTVQDTKEFFVTLALAKKEGDLERIFLEGYEKNHKTIEGIFSLIEYLYDLNSYRSRGYEFLIGKVPKKSITSPYKRWNMYLRWMVRDDNIDLGLWKSVKKSDLLIPLDTHTFTVGRKLGLINRKSYDFKSVLELSESLRKFDSEDPIKYDFALYRIGQEKIL